MIVITGAAGFIASNLVAELNQLGIDNLILVDDFTAPSKEKNHAAAKCILKIQRTEFLQWFKENGASVNFVFHLGARTDTTESNQQILDELNLNYSKAIWTHCAHFNIPLIYASSAATYGDGSLGYKDDHALVEQLQPLNLYGISKNEFDRWALQQTKTPPHWYGLKFFNVFGPNETHKNRMASVVYHAYHQIKEKGHVSLFQSHRLDYKDGEQLRDFIYVKEVVNICLFLQKNLPAFGLYNVGSGKAHTFNDLVRFVFEGLQLQPDIRYIPMPQDLQGKYQYFTEADMHKLLHIDYKLAYSDFKSNILEYLKNIEK